MNKLDRALLVIGYLGLVVMFGISLARTNAELNEASIERCVIQQSWTDALATALTVDSNPNDIDPTSARLARAAEELRAATDAVCGEE